jgi:hypothetical protein
MTSQNTDLSSWDNLYNFLTQYMAPKRTICLEVLYCELGIDGSSSCPMAAFGISGVAAMEPIKIWI